MANSVAERRSVQSRNGLMATLCIVFAVAAAFIIPSTALKMDFISPRAEELVAAEVDLCIRMCLACDDPKDAGTQPYARPLCLHACSVRARST